MLRIPTSVEVYRAIVDKHAGKGLGVFSSFSNPDGRAFGGGGEKGEMWTQWGFADANVPILEARSTWDIEEDISEETPRIYPGRTNEVHLYWLLVAQPGDFE